MVQIISGKTGNGKTKYLLDKVNGAVNTAQGSVVYVDKTAKHMYELNNRVRLINASEYPISSYDGFIGFLCGIISQDHDIEQMYLDSFLKLAYLEGCDITDTLALFDNMSKKYEVNFILSISLNTEEIPEAFRSNVIVSL